MAHFANPLFGDASRQLEIFSQNRLRAPILEGQLRASLAQARRSNALAGLSEQTLGSRNENRGVIDAGPGDDPSGFLRAVAAIAQQGGDTGNLGQLISTLFSAPDSVERQY